MKGYDDMARFNNFGDYMFSLLFTPLRKGKQAANQFFIFFKIVGTLFDDCKQDIFRVREESMVISASETMLNEHGKDRKMPRLKNEDIETYRTRLSMKAITAEKAGTKEGIILAVKSLGYLSTTIIPYYEIDPLRWAEFLVSIRLILDYDKNIDYAALRAAVRGVKEASSLENYEFIYTHKTTGINEEQMTLKVVNSIQLNWWSTDQSLDGSIFLDGSKNLDTDMIKYPLTITYHSDPPEIIKFP